MIVTCFVYMYTYVHVYMVYMYVLYIVNNHVHSALYVHV